MRRSAATQFLRALATRPDDTELLQQAFIASLVAGRSEAVQLARQLPDSQAAQLLLGQAEVRAGHWPAAEQRFRALPRQGLTQLLQPLLIAWSQQGDGRTDAALATLRPFIDGQRFRGDLCAACRADRRPGRPLGGGREAVSPGADRIWRHEPAPRADPGERPGAPRPSRRGAAHPRRAGRRCAGYEHRPAGADRRQHDPAGAARDRTGSPRPISRSRPPCARRTPATSPCWCCAWRSTCGPTSPPRGCWRPTSWTSQRHVENALQMLAPVANDDPLIAVVRLQRAALTERLGHSEEAMHATAADRPRLSRQLDPRHAGRRPAARQAALRRGDRRL